MKRKIIFGLCTTVFASMLSNNIVANVFPVNPVKLYEQCTPSPVVNSDTVPNFCTIFPLSVGSCAGIPSPKPQQMQGIYNEMIEIFGPTLTQACTKEAKIYHSGVQACIDQWNCYWHGGKDSQGGLCSGTGNQCTTLPPLRG